MTDSRQRSVKSHHRFLGNDLFTFASIIILFEFRLRMNVVCIIDETLVNLGLASLQQK